MEFRVAVQIRHLSLDAEDKWDYLIRTLENRCGELGPVLSWDDEDTARITLAMDGRSPAVAAGEATKLIGDVMGLLGLEHLFPSVVEVEPIKTDEPAVVPHR
jgi:hypothetical protein